MRVILVFISAIFVLMSCDPQPEQKKKSSTSTLSKPKKASSNEKSVRVLLDGVFQKKLSVILVNEPDSNTSSIHLQDYVVDGASFIPVFTSKKDFTASTGGMDIGKPVMEINGLVLLALLNGNESLKINPSLPTEQNFNASDLTQVYKTEIDSIRKEFKRLENKINSDIQITQ